MADAGQLNIVPYAANDVVLCRRGGQGPTATPVLVDPLTLPGVAAYGSSAEINVTAYIPISNNHSQAVLNACNALPGNGGTVYLPAGFGTYTLSDATVLPNKSIRIRGDGLGVTIVNVAQPGFPWTIQAGSAYSNVFEFEGITFRAAYQFGLIAGVATIAYAQTASQPLPSVAIKDVRIEAAPTGTGTQNAFITGFDLNGCWNVRTDRYEMYGPGLIADGAIGAVFTGLQSYRAPAGTSMLRLANCISVQLTGINVYYVDNVVFQYGYCEGIGFFNPTVVGCNKLMAQASAGQPFGATFNGDAGAALANGDEVYCFGGEINTVDSVFTLSRFSNGCLADTNITQYLYSPTGFTAFDLTDVSYWFCGVHKAEVSAPGQALTTYLKLTSTGTPNVNCTNNCVSDANVHDFTTDIRFVGAAVSNSQIRFQAVYKGGAIAAPVFNWPNENGTNSVSWPGAPGVTGCNSGLHGFANAVDGSVFLAEDLAGTAAPNYPLTIAHPSGGAAPSYGVGGQDTNIGLDLIPKGTGPIGLMGPVRFFSRLQNAAAIVGVVAIPIPENTPLFTLLPTGAITSCVLTLPSKGEVEVNTISQVANLSFIVPAGSGATIVGSIPTTLPPNTSIRLAFNAGLNEWYVLSVPAAGGGGGGVSIGTTTGTAADGGIAQTQYAAIAANAAATNANTTNIAALGTLAALRANNLSDLASAATARTNLGLGTAATQAASAFDAAGTSAAETTRAQAAEALAAQKANNLSDLANASTARTNLGVAYGTAAGTVAQGNDTRITGTPVAVTATGTTQSGAAPLTGQFNLATLTTGNTAVSLQAIAGEQNLVNTQPVGGLAMQVFPLGSSTINGGAAGAAVSIPGGTSFTVRSTNGTTFTGAIPIDPAVVTANTAAIAAVNHYRTVSGTTDTPTTTDGNSGFITYTNAAAVTITLNDLGAGQNYVIQQLGAGQLQCVAGSGVTLGSDRTSPSYKTALQYAELAVTCTGTGSVIVTGNMQ